MLSSTMTMRAEFSAQAPSGARQSMTLIRKGHEKQGNKENEGHGEWFRRFDVQIADIFENVKGEKRMNE